MINLNYFKRFFKDSLIFLAFLSIIFVIASIANMTNVKVSETMEQGVYFLQTHFIVNTIYPLYALAILGPLYVLNYKDSKRKADVYFSLPINKRALLNTRISVVLIDIFLALLVGLSFSSLILLPKANIFKALDVALFFGLYFSAYLAFIPCFLIVLFFANLGNNLIDRTIFGISSLFAFMFTVNIVFKFIYGVGGSEYFNDGYPLMFGPLAPLNYVYDVFWVTLWQHALESEITKVTLGEYNLNYLPSVIISIFSIIALILTELKEEKIKIEEIGETSKSVLGYKFLLTFTPAIVIGFLQTNRIHLIGDWISIIYIEVVIIAIFFILYFIYKKKFIFQKDFLIYGGIALLVDIITILSTIYMVN